MQKHKLIKKVVAVMMGIAILGTATASDQALDKNDKSVPDSVLDVSSIKQETNYTKALTELEKARYQLTRARQGIFDDSAGSAVQTGMPGMFNAPPVPVSAPKSTDESPTSKTPRLTAVYGGARLKAQFKMGDGSVIEAAAGDSLPGGYQVKSVSVERVLLTHDGKVINVGS